MKKSLKKDVLVDICIWTVAMLFAFLVPLDAHPQAVNCNSIVALDQANVFSDSSAIGKAASGLIDQGADVHVVSVGDHDAGAGLANVESFLERFCPSWVASGHRKPNLFVLMVAPTLHKKNVFFGGAYTPAMPSEDSVNVVYSQAANPFFKQGDFSGGMAASLKDFSAKVAAYHDQQKHPIQQTTTVNNQATDMGGFWTFLGWALGLLAAGLGIWGIVYLIGSRRKQVDSVSMAQDEATKARSRATRLYNSYSPVSAEFSARFLDLSNSVSNDPTSEGLTALKYQSIRDVWNDFSTDILNSQSAFTDKPNDTPDPPRVRRHTDYPTATRTSRGGYVTPPPVAAPVSTTVDRTVVVHNDNSGDLLTGVLLGEALSSPTRRDYDYDRPSYSPPSSGGGGGEQEDTEPSSGSDSSWSTSSDDSSSGSDSSFSSDSGSSDFGGGGSDSDF